MSYTRHTWASGDVVSVSRLNNIEDGIEGGFLAKHTVTDDTLDCSYNDLVAEVNAGKLPYLYYNATYRPFDVLTALEYASNNYKAFFGLQNHSDTWYSNTSPDQPLYYAD